MRIGTRPVALATRMRLPATRSAMTALGLGTAVVVSGAIYLNLRRRLEQATA